MTGRSDQDDEQWQAAQDAAATGDVLPFPSAHEDEADARWDAELAFYADLEAEGQPWADPSDGEADAALIDAALAATADDRQDAPAEAVRGILPIVAVIVAAAAAAVLWLAWPAGSALSTSQGSWVAEGGGGHGEGDALPLAMWLVAGAETCAGIDGDAFCVAEGTAVRVRNVEKRELELERGEVRVTSGRWSVVVAGDRHELAAGQSFVREAAVEASAAAGVDAAAAPVPSDTAGPPELDDALDHERPETPEPADKSRAARAKAPPEDAAALLSRARKLRGEKQTRGADRAYTELIRRFPKTGEARAARVALGRIRLEAGRSKSALQLFDGYLRVGGSLAEEAAWGRIQALHRLGRTEALRTAVAGFERKFPRSVYRKRAQERIAP